MSGPTKTRVVGLLAALCAQRGEVHEYGADSRVRDLSDSMNHPAGWYHTPDKVPTRENVIAACRWLAENIHSGVMVQAGHVVAALGAAADHLQGVRADPARDTSSVVRSPWFHGLSHVSLGADRLDSRWATVERPRWEGGKFRVTLHYPRTGETKSRHVDTWHDTEKEAFDAAEAFVLDIYTKPV